METTRAAAAAALERTLRTAPLAPGWDELADASGPYYVNPSTGASVRERPAAAMVEQSKLALAASAAAAVQVERVAVAQQTAAAAHAQQQAAQRRP